PYPANVDPASGVAIRTTGVPAANVALQVAPQAIPGGELATVPEPVPDFDRFRLKERRLKVACTSASAVTGKLQMLPVQALVKPPNADAALGVAVMIAVAPGA